MCAALYSALTEISAITSDPTTQNDTRQKRLQTEVRLREMEISSFDPKDKSASAIALSEALCSIDEDNKHTAQIDNLLEVIRKSVERKKAAVNLYEIKDVTCIIETYADQLAFTEIGRNSMKVTSFSNDRCF
jgi:hypothetical protein